MPRTTDRAERARRREHVIALPDLRAALDEGKRVEVRTPGGRWRFVCAVYSDNTVGTIRTQSEWFPGEGRFSIIDLFKIADWREEER